MSLWCESSLVSAVAVYENGTVAHVATIDNSGAIGATLKREDTVYSFGEFVEKIPGASVLTK